MKKLFSVLLAAALVLSIGATSAFAASDTRGANFTDTNKDGVCDVYGGADADGDGICDSCPNDGVRPLDGTGIQAGRGNAGQGAGFVDADGDGICDSCPNDGVRPLDGTGIQAGRGNAGQGAGFVDADGDGICDNFLKGGFRAQDGPGAKRGRMVGCNK